MKAYTYLGQGKAALIDKPEPQLQGPRDALVRVTLGSICTSDLHILHGSVPRAVPGITLGHEMVGVLGPAGRPGGGQCGDVLWLVLLLPSRLCEQLQ